MFPEEIPCPPREELVREYCMPPLGLGRRMEDIGTTYQVSRSTVNKWLAHYGLVDRSYERACWNRRSRRAPAPPLSELETLYYMPPHGQGLSTETIAKHYSVSRPSVERWIQDYGIHQSFGFRHSQRMSGVNSPTYKNGNSQGYAKRMLKRLKPNVCCEWCGTKERVQIHHIDHDREHNTVENLMWLCGNCNIIEAHLWALRQSGRAVVSFNPNQIVITFNKEE